MAECELDMNTGCTPPPAGLLHTAASPPAGLNVDYPLPSLSPIFDQPPNTAHEVVTVAIIPSTHCPPGRVKRRDGLTQSYLSPFMAQCAIYVS